MFEIYDDLIVYTKPVHHPVVKCRECGKEVIHEKDKSHHVRQDHEQRLDCRIHKDSYKRSKLGLHKIR